MSSQRGGHFWKLLRSAKKLNSYHRPIALTNTIRYSGALETNIINNLNSLIRNLEINLGRFHTFFSYFSVCVHFFSSSEFPLFPELILYLSDLKLLFLVRIWFVWYILGDRLDLLHLLDVLDVLDLLDLLELLYLLD